MTYITLETSAKIVKSVHAIVSLHLRLLSEETLSSGFNFKVLALAQTTILLFVGWLVISSVESKIIPLQKSLELLHISSVVIAFSRRHWIKPVDLT